MEDKLTLKQEKFCLEYAKTGNATDAYIKAGYSDKKCSAEVGGCKLLKEARIQRRLKELADEMRSPKIADAEECQAVLTKILRSPKSKDLSKIEATKVLLKVQGAFVTNVNLNSAIPVVISGAEDLED